MKKIISICALFVLFNCLTATAQYAVPIRDGKACGMITQSQLKTYLRKLENLVNIAQQDKDKFGITGAYPATAIHFHLNARLAYDSLKAAVDWLNTGSDNIPDNTNYVEASGIKHWIRETISALLGANHWAELSAIYHNSSYASCGKEEALRLLAEAVNILAYAGRCYTEPYKEIPPPNCK